VYVPIALKILSHFNLFYLFILCCVVVFNDVNTGLVFKGSCECSTLSLAVRLRLFDVDRIVCGVCLMSK